MEIEGGRAIIYGLGKRRWAVPARFPQFEGAPNPDAQTPAGKLQKITFLTEPYRIWLGSTLKITES